MIDRRIRRSGIGLLAAGLALTAALWPSRPQGAQAVAVVPAAPEEPPLDGDRRSSGLKGCATCHDGPISLARFAVGPSLGRPGRPAADHVAGLDGPRLRPPIGAPAAGLRRSRLRRSLHQMPTLAVSDEELDALVQYLLG